MKKRYTIYTAFLLLMVIGCSKSDFSSILYEPDGRDVPQEIQERYDVLINNDEGWLLAYKPSDKSDTVFMHLQFENEEQYSYAVDREGYLEPTQSTYEIKGTYDAELTFETNSIWGDLKDQFHGATKFHILFENDGVFLRRSDGFDGRKFELKPMGTTERQLFNTKVQEEKDRIAYREHLLALSKENVLKVRELASLDIAYFNNITLGDEFRGLYDLDTVAQKLTVYWMSGAGRNEASTPYHITPWGLSFEQPLDLGILTVDSLNFGEFAGNNLHIDATNGIPAGSLAQEHTPNFLYPTANEYVFRLSESDFKARWQFATNDDETGIGPGLRAEHQAVLDLGMTFGGYNLYVNNASTGHNRYGFTVTLNGSAYYQWHQDILEEADNSLTITQSTSVPESSLGNTNFNNLSAERKEVIRNFYRKLLQGGVYVWPNGRASNGNQSVRIVNKQNSTIYLTLKWISGNKPPIGYID